MPRLQLQRLSSPSRGFSALVHLTGLGCFLSSLAWQHRYPNPITMAWGGQYQFLTIIGLVLSALTFTCGLLADLTLNRQLFELKNALSVCSAPLEVLVSILYWGLCAIDKTLVVPPDLHLPLLPDIGFHAVPAVMMTLDFVLLSPPWTVRAYGAMSISMAVAFLYWGWVEICFSQNGWYPYPIFAILKTWQRVILFTFSAMLMTCSTLLLNWVYASINGVETFKKKALHPVKVD